jgi:hypothetical protein
MADPLDGLLRLVAEGRLTAEEAAPLIDALQGTAARGTPGDDSTTDDGPTETTGPADATGAGRSRPTALRIEVSEHGVSVVNLRVPLNLGRMALDHVPGLSSEYVSRIREALAEGLTGSLLVVNEGEAGDGVRIILE